MKKWLPPHGTKLTLPYIGVNDPRFTWSSGSDVQATWRKYGWTPPSEHMTPPAEFAAEVIALAHRKAWRYKKSSDPHHSDTYTFNESTLLDFVAAILAQKEPVAPFLYGCTECGGANYGCNCESTKGLTIPLYDHYF